MWVVLVDVEGYAVGNQGIEIDRCIAGLDLDCDGTCNVHSCEIGCGMLITCC